MIHKLILQNFKCFAENEIEFNKFTILTGINAAGKSSVIQALLLYSRAMKSEPESLLDVSEILGINVGSPKNMVSQNARRINDVDFGICVDGDALDFYIDKANGLDIRANRNGAKRDIDIYYLNAERIGPRMSYYAGGSEQFKQDGSNAVYLMERADNMNLRIPEELMIDNVSAKFSYQVECWMSLIMGNVRLSTKVEADKAQAELKIQNELAQASVIPTLTGFGISYELSVVVAGLWAAAKRDGVLLVENPEAHLHPSAQSAIGKFLAMVATCGVQVIAETHSEHVIDGARIQMYAMDCQHELIVNYFSHDEKNVIIQQLLIEDNGELSEWPDGFFDQKQNDLRELFELRRKHDNNKPIG